MENNTVTLKMFDIANVNYIPNSLVMPEGKAHDKDPQPSFDDGKWKVFLKADREGSASVASQFIAACGGNNYIFSPDKPDVVFPTLLNFYFGVSMYINVGESGVWINVYLGQGHYTESFGRSVNNWWIGSTWSFRRVGSRDAMLVLPKDDGIYDVLSISGGVDTFDFSSWSEELATIVAAK